MIFSQYGVVKPKIKTWIDNGWKPSVLVCIVLIAPVYLITAWQEYKNALQLIPYSTFLINQLETDINAVWDYKPKND